MQFFPFDKKKALQILSNGQGIPQKRRNVSLTKAGFHQKPSQNRTQELRQLAKYYSAHLKPLLVPFDQRGALRWIVIKATIFRRRVLWWLGGITGHLDWASTLAAGC